MNSQKVLVPQGVEGRDTETRQLEGSFQEGYGRFQLPRPYDLRGDPRCLDQRIGRIIYNLFGT